MNYFQKSYFHRKSFQMNCPFSLVKANSCQLDLNSYPVVDLAGFADIAVGYFVAQIDFVGIVDFVDFVGFVDSNNIEEYGRICLLYTSPSPRDGLLSRM